jgi:hypothetical protein
VGWVYAAAKLRPPPRGRVERRLEEIGTLARFQKAAETLPEFFHHCFAPNVLDFLLAARRHLDWRRSAIDRTLMAILLVDLHGKRTLALSNQMRQTKSMSPEYAIRWWKERSLSPPERDPVAFVLKKLRWRYAKGIPVTTGSHVYLGDSTHDLWAMRTRTDQYAPYGAKLLLTSPPYFGVTNYHYDQWLRLWLLGGPDYPCSYGDKHRGKFTNAAEYESLLYTAFAYAADLLAADADGVLAAAVPR